MLGYSEERHDIKALKAWHNARVVPGYDSMKWRKDAHGAWIRYADHGLVSRHGWRISNTKTPEAVHHSYAVGNAGNGTMRTFDPGNRNAVVTLSVVLLTALGFML